MKHVGSGGNFQLEKRKGKGRNGKENLKLKHPDAGKMREKVGKAINLKAFKNKLSVDFDENFAVEK